MTSDDNKTPEAHLAMKARMKGGPRNSITSLQVLVQMWRAPNVAMAEHGPMDPNYRISRGQMVSLDDQVSQWMGPNVPSGGRSTTHAERVGNTLYHEGKKVQMGLESQASSWAAPRTSDTNGAGEHGDGGLDLRTQAAKWSSTKASDPEKAGPNMRGSKGDMPLPSQAARWAGPCARNHKGSSGSIFRQDGKSRADLLHYQAEQFFHPPSSPDRPIAGGSMSSTDSPNSNQPSAKRKLNPIFVEALMRWPTGLSGFARQETAWTRWWRLQLTFVSALCSPAREAEPAQREMF